MSRPLSRLRFAPSPTGSLHVGNARTAVVNWLVACRTGGELVLRIEDTDARRNDPGAEVGILDDLHWLGIDWHEGPGSPGQVGPYRQSERGRHYRAAVEQLVASGNAYPCFCSPEELTEARRLVRSAGGTYNYSGACRELSTAEVKRRLSHGVKPSVRFRVSGQDVGFVDGLRGVTGLRAGQVGDFVIQRANGRPTYNLACVVDDHHMAIDHVIRGEDHLPNTPRQVLLYEALKLEVPRFTHLPLLLGPDRSRLSKRHGSTTIAQLRLDGILPEALVNYLGLLGWAPEGGQEVMSLAEIAEVFDLSALSSSGAIFDQAKLEWLNTRHLEAIDSARALEAMAPFLSEAGFVVPKDTQQGWWKEAVDLVRPGLRRMSEIQGAIRPFFAPGGTPELDPPRARALAAFKEASLRGDLHSPESFRLISKAIGTQTGVTGKRLFHPLRVALTGADTGPELARLVPLLERGAAAGIEPPVASVAERLERALLDLANNG